MNINKIVLILILILIIGTIIGLLISNNKKGESVVSSDTAESGVVEGDTENDEAPMGADIVDAIQGPMSGLHLDFAHTNPGVSSEIYATVLTTPGNEVKTELYSDQEIINTKTVTADENGTAYITFTIRQFGSYYVKSYDGTETNGGFVIVE